MDVKDLSMRIGQPEAVLGPLVAAVNDDEYATYVSSNGVVDFTTLPDGRPKLLIAMLGHAQYGIVQVDGIEWIKTSSFANCIGLMTVRHEAKKLMERQ